MLLVAPKLKLGAGVAAGTFGVGAELAPNENDGAGAVVTAGAGVGADVLAPKENDGFGASAADTGVATGGADDTPKEKVDWAGFSGSAGFGASGCFAGAPKENDGTGAAVVGAGLGAEGVELAPNENDGFGASVTGAVTGTVAGTIEGAATGAATTGAALVAVVLGAPNENAGAEAFSAGFAVDSAPKENVGFGGSGAFICSTVFGFSGSLGFATSANLAPNENEASVVFVGNESAGVSTFAGSSSTGLVITGRTGVGGGVGVFGFGMSKKPSGTFAFRLISPLVTFGFQVPFHFFVGFSSGEQERFFEFGFCGEIGGETGSGFGRENSTIWPFLGVAVLINFTGAQGLRFSDSVVLALIMLTFGSFSAKSFSSSVQRVQYLMFYKYR